MWKRRLLLGGLVALCLLGLALLALVPPRPVSRENHAKLRVGMSDQRAEAILGGPAHHSEKVLFRVNDATGRANPTNETSKRWVGDGRTIVLLVDENQTVTGVTFLGDEGPVFPWWRELTGTLLLALVLALLGHLWRVRPSLLTVLHALIGGAVLPVVAGAGGWGFGA